MKKILLTGGSGFIGRQILSSEYGNDIYSLNRSVFPSHDLSKFVPVLDQNYEHIIHCAGIAHMKSESSDSYKKINVEGTMNLLKAFDRTGLPKSFLFLSSVAVYGKVEGSNISEETELTAVDPYGYSKIQAEELLKIWCKKNHVKLCILRLPLVAGKHPPGNLGSMVEAIRRGYFFNIAKGKARRSMVLLDDVVSIIPKIFDIEGIFNLTDGFHPSFYEISQLIAKQLQKSEPRNIPIEIARGLAFLGDFLKGNIPFNSDKLVKMVSTLTFDDTLARQTFDWKPKGVLEEFKIK